MAFTPPLTDELLTKLAAKSGTVSATPDFSKRSSGSSGGSSSGKATYKVTTSAVNNGGVNASPSNAEKGATITITLSPDKGYKLDKLTVTDGSGKTVSTVKKSDTVYTFTMPASAVKVGVSYVKATETPSKTKFNDVSANDWFASAVDYVTGKGMMNGTADNTFSPKANTTRGMVVTVLYRLENQPSTSAASFTDVASGAYYANAVAWANANGIVSGYGSGKFGPNDKVTREQLAAILYRYAQYKKYDVSVGEDTNILSYDDAQSISTYAIPAIQWACGAGVVTGKSGSKLDPKGNATRAEVAAMLMRFCENVKSKQNLPKPHSFGCAVFFALPKTFFYGKMENRGEGERERRKSYANRSNCQLYLGAGRRRDRFRTGARPAEQPERASADAVRHVFDRYRHQFHYQGGQHDSGRAGDSGGVYHRAPAAP